MNTRAILALIALAVFPTISLAAGNTVAMNQNFHLGGFEYAVSSVHWLAKTSPQAEKALAEPGCRANGTNGILAFTFAVKSEEHGEGAMGAMAIVATYKNGAQPSTLVNVGGPPDAYVYGVCDAPKPTKANPLTKVRFGNGNNDAGYPKYFYLKNPPVSL